MKKNPSMLEMEYPGLLEVIAEEAHARPSLTPEEIMILLEEMRENERAAKEASQVEGLDLR